MPNEFAAQACDCFEKQSSGSIDSKLDLCLSKPINENFEAIHKLYYSDRPAEEALKKYMMDVTISMVNSCDKFYNEVDSMYTNFFPQTTLSSVKGDLAVIQDSLMETSLPDSIKINLINKSITLLTKARAFDQAMIYINTLENDFHKQNDTYFVKAYIFRSKGQFPQAIAEIDKLIQAGNDDMRFILALLIREQNGR